MNDDFHVLIQLLSEKKADSKIISDLLQYLPDGEFRYKTFNQSSPGNTKDNILYVYERRAQMESERDNAFVEGYVELLPALRQTGHEHICISLIDTSKGCYVIFTDFGKSDLIGVLKSKRTLNEIKGHMDP
jgi:hypothetical protein